MLKKVYLNFIRRLSRSKKDFFYRFWRRELGRIYPKNKQFEAFDDALWKDGFHYTGEVMDSKSNNQDFGQGVTYYEIYTKGILPFINKESQVLEIGPGRGSWTKGLLEAREVWAIDAKSLRNNQIMEYLGHPRNLKYLQVKDFECRDLPDNHFDFLFSYGVFCHIPWDGIVQYTQNFYSKMKSGGVGMIMISDEIKCPENINYGEWYPGCFIPNNSVKMSQQLENCGFLVQDPDFLSCKRDSILYFIKP